MRIYACEHDWGYELACKHDDFVEARTLKWLDEVEDVALRALEKHPAIFLAFEASASEEVQLFTDHTRSLEGWPAERVIIGTEDDYHDIMEPPVKVVIDFGPDLDPYSDFDPPEPW